MTLLLHWITWLLDGFEHIHLLLEPCSMPGFAQTLALGKLEPGSLRSCASSSQSVRHWEKPFKVNWAVYMQRNLARRQNPETYFALISVSPSTREDSRGSLSLSLHSLSAKEVLDSARTVLTASSGHASARPTSARPGGTWHGPEFCRVHTSLPSKAHLHDLCSFLIPDSSHSSLMTLYAATEDILNEDLSPHKYASFKPVPCLSASQT